MKSKTWGPYVQSVSDLCYATASAHVAPQDAHVAACTTLSTIDAFQLDASRVALGSPTAPTMPPPTIYPCAPPTIHPIKPRKRPTTNEANDAHVVATDLLSGATEHARQVLVAPAPALPGLQCPMCKRELCQAHSLCFFRRINPQGGVEVHLMLKPEAPVPPTFVRAPEAEKGATQTWQCACGAKMGDTRPIGPSKASMTAFKSSSVMLHGQHHTAKKSMWPRIYDSPLFNDIEVRSRDSFHGI